MNEPRTRITTDKQVPDLAVLLGPADVATLSIDRSSRWAWVRRSALRGRAAARQSTSETGSA
jgi:hypothetical protein